jgi:hypothetical protein
VRYQEKHLPFTILHFPFGPSHPASLFNRDLIETRWMTDEKIPMENGKWQMANGKYEV